MKPSVQVTTLQDRRPRLWCAHRRDHPGGRAAERHLYPDALSHRRTHRYRRLPSVPGRSEGQQQAAAGLRHPVQEGMEVTTTSPRLQQLPQGDPGNAVLRAQPHLLGMRVERSLRTADPGSQKLGMTHVSVPYLLSQARSGCLAIAALSPITTAAFCARAACASATRSKARTPGICSAAASTPASSAT